MPELPEVEVVKKSLDKAVTNKTIKKVKIYDGNLRYKINKIEASKINGLKILRIKRRSKYLIFFFNKDIVMLVHLGMTGKFILIKKNNYKQKTSFYYEINKTSSKHDRLEFTLTNKLQLIYNDIRKFGFIKFYLSKDLSKSSHLSLLGPEPLETKFNLIYFKKYLVGRKRCIKDLLMDQKFVSGIGNIYANEILFLSKILPNRKVSSLKIKELKKILIFTKKVLKKAIFFGGSSIKDFSNASGKKGKFQQVFNVYGKIGHNCSNPDCTGEIKKIVISNRASFLCTKCQK
tara:strand:+ start:795 stop:1661 length:867 start_codon:yes stop_codon:yes gene_type:complete